MVPKEIRRTLRIREGDPMEIFTNHEGEIILKKYSPIGEMDKFAKEYAEVLAQNSNFKVIVSDRDQVIAVAGTGKKEYLEKNISNELEKLMMERETLSTINNSKSPISITENEKTEICGQVISPIICEGDVIGSVILMSKDEKQNITATEQKLVSVAAAFLGKQMEN